MADSNDRKRKGGDFCSAVACTSARNKHSCAGKSFFRFPKDAERCRKWVQNMRREDLVCVPPDTLIFRGYKLCSDHFEDSQFTCAAGRRRLLWNAVPTLFTVPNPPPRSTPRRKQPKKREASCKPEKAIYKRPKLSGKPAYEMSQNDPDWIPTPNLGHHGAKKRQSNQWQQTSQKSECGCTSDGHGENAEEEEEEWQQTTSQTLSHVDCPSVEGLNPAAMLEVKIEIDVAEEPPWQKQEDESQQHKRICSECIAYQDKIWELEDVVADLKAKLESAHARMKSMTEASSQAQIDVDGERPRPGRVGAETARAFNMVELAPHSGVFLYPKHLRRARRKPDGTSRARVLLSCFYSTQELIEAGNMSGANGRCGLSTQIIDAIVEYCVEAPQKNDVASIKIALRSKISAAISDVKRRNRTNSPTAGV